MAGNKMLVMVGINQKQKKLSDICQIYIMESIRIEKEIIKANRSGKSKMIVSHLCYSKQTTEVINDKIKLRKM